MKSLSRKLLWVIGIFLVALVGIGWFTITNIAPIATAYTAKRMCSGVFVSHRDTASILNEDLANYPYVGTNIDYDDKSVTASILGMAKRTAIYREGLGSTLVIGTTEEMLRAQAAGFERPQTEDRSMIPWPDGDLVAQDVSSEIDAVKLGHVMDEAFLEPDPDNPVRTRAIVVVYDGQIIAERYAQGITQETALLGWSMTKSTVNALVGILVNDGRLSLKEPAPVTEWQEPGDPRGAITLDQLMRMSSGLQFSEIYDDPFADVVVMLFAQGDAGGYAANKPLEVEPDSRWQYSSGTTNIISRIIRHTIGGSDVDYFAFPRQALFDRIGMQTALIEPDTSGTFVGSSFMYASARDWARLGLLFLNDGVWNGERILPEGWVKYSTTPTQGAPMGRYGAQFWLNAGTPGNVQDRWMPRVPADMYSMLGFEGQHVTIIPSKKFVIVRLGLSQPEELWDHEAFVAGVIESVAP